MISKKIGIAGGGITGLVTALNLQKSGIKTDLFERRNEPGGAIKSEKQNGWQVEYGPNTLLLKDRVVSEFLQSTGLEPEKIAANPDASKRFIVKNGELVPLPGSLAEAVRTPLFSLKAKARVLGEPFVSKSRNPDQTVAEFVERRLGREMLDYAINPFVAGIFANQPENLSLRHAFPVMDDLEQQYGSLIAGSVGGRSKRNQSGRIPRELISFRTGMQQLAIDIARQLDQLHLNHEITKIYRDNGGWMIDTQMGAHGPYTDVVVNIPLYRWTSGLLPVDAAALSELRKVNYSPLSVMHLGYRHDQIGHPLDGFGFLVPEKENRSILGALFSSTLFEGRAPAGHHLLTVFVGGGRQPKLAHKQSEELLELVQEELRDLIHVNGAPVFKNHVYWPSSIPGYHVGYDEILNLLDDLEHEKPGLHFAGNYRGGISVPDCIKNGIRLAEDLSR